jgi:hypothetical protein
VAPPGTADCKVTYGGWITARTGDRGAFSGEANSSSTAVPTGRQSYRDAGPVVDYSFSSTETASVVCSSGRVQIYGNGTVNGTPVAFRIDLTDGGRNDTYRIVWAGATPYDSGEQPLRGGNVTVH